LSALRSALKRLREDAGNSSRNIMEALMLYRNIIEYAASKGLYCGSMDEARALLTARLSLDEPKHTSDNFRSFVNNERLLRLVIDDGARDSSFTLGYAGDYNNVGIWALYTTRIVDVVRNIRTKTNTTVTDDEAVRYFMREKRRDAKLNARGEAAARSFGMLSLETADNMAYVTANRLTTDLEREITALWPWQKNSRFRASVTLSRDARVDAGYDRGRARFIVSDRALKVDLPYGQRVLAKSIILDVVEIGDGLWWAKWATRKTSRSPHLIVMTGAVCEKGLFAGFDKLSDVIESQDLIRKKARIHAVSRVLKEAV
jgi:hypothetical protein